jgi:ABC-type transporter Mla MlaB component
MNSSVQLIGAKLLQLEARIEILENSYIMSITPPVTTMEENSSSVPPLTGNDWVTFSLPPVLTLSGVSDLKKKLNGYLGRRVRLSGERVERIDSAALQLLLAFINDPNVTIGWINPSLEIYNVARLLGLTTHLNLPSKL